MPSNVPPNATVPIKKPTVYTKPITIEEFGFQDYALKDFKAKYGEPLEIQTIPSRYYDEINAKYEFADVLIAPYDLLYIEISKNFTKDYKGKFKLPRGMYIGMTISDLLKNLPEAKNSTTIYSEEVFKAEFRYLDGKKQMTIHGKDFDMYINIDNERISAISLFIEQ